MEHEGRAQFRLQHYIVNGPAYQRWYSWDLSVERPLDGERVSTVTCPHCGDDVAIRVFSHEKSARYRRRWRYGCRAVLLVSSLILIASLASLPYSDSDAAGITAFLSGLFLLASGAGDLINSSLTYGVTMRQKVSLTHKLFS